MYSLEIFDRTVMKPGNVSSVWTCVNYSHSIHIQLNNIINYSYYGRIVKCTIWYRTSRNCSCSGLISQSSSSINYFVQISQAKHILQLKMMREHAAKLSLNKEID